MIGIYCIEQISTGKKYIGKSKNIPARISVHKCSLTRDVRSKDANLHLYNSVKKYGIDDFRFYPLEVFTELNESLLAEAELRYMDAFKTTDREYGFNLRRDSSSKMIVHDETRIRLSDATRGQLNGNFGNKWTDAQKLRMSNIAKSRHASGVYGDDWKSKISVANSVKWKDLSKKAKMAERVSIAKCKKFEFEQYSIQGELIRVWDSVREIVAINPEYKWQNIYSVCNRYKPTYKGYVWRKVQKNESHS